MSVALIVATMIIARNWKIAMPFLRLITAKIAMQRQTIAKMPAMIPMGRVMSFFSFFVDNGIDREDNQGWDDTQDRRSNRDGEDSCLRTDIRNNSCQSVERSERCHKKVF